MQAVMNIMVRVYSNQAQAKMAALQAQQKAAGAQTAAMNAQVAASNRQTPLGQHHISSLMKFGNQLQWTGRMLLYNFTLPLAVAGGAAVKWSMEQDKAMTHVKKVYGDTAAATKYFENNQKALQDVQARHPDVTDAASAATATFREEIEALDRAFTALSNHYGVTKKEVNEIAGAWAAAGASGLDLAESVKSTLTAMVIGDMDATKATEALIQIQGQYNLSSTELMETLATLNSVENQTGASMSDLIVSFSRAAGVARSAGVDVQELAAMTAALVPAAGSASHAGNALKTIFSRLLAPTNEASQIISEMGFNVKEQAWNSATAADRLKILARQYETMGAAQKNWASSIIASRWQINKFDILMRELTNTNGYYAKALSATEDQAESTKRMMDELQTVLESDPRKLERTWVMLQNAMVDIIQPLIPFILYLADSIAELAQSFADLNPYVSKTILFLLVLLALVGPVVRYIGALATLWGVFAVALRGVGQGFGIFSRNVTDADGETKKARKGVLQFLKALTITPLLKFATMFMGVMGFIASGFRKMALFLVADWAKTITVMATTGAYKGLIATTGAVFGSLQSIAKAGFSGLIGMQFAHDAASVASTAASTSRRVFTVNAAGEMMVATETTVGQQRYTVSQVFGNRIANQARMVEAARVLALESGSATRRTTEAAEAQQRVFIASSTGTYVAAAEEASQVRRTLALEAGTATRVASEQWGEGQRTFALNAGASTRAASEAAYEGQRVFIVNRAGMARAVSENAAEVKRVITVNAAGVARVTSEARAAQGILAISAGTYGRLLAIETAEGANRSAIANLMAASRLATEAESAYGRTFIVESAGIAQTTAERAAAEARLAAILAFAAGAKTAEALAQAELLAIQVSYHTRSVALWEAYWAYLAALRAGQNAAMNGIEAGASASRLAIEAGAQSKQIAVVSAGGVQRVAAESTAQAAQTSVVRTGQAAVTATYATAGAAQVAVARKTALATVSATAAGQSSILLLTKNFFKALARYAAVALSALAGPWGVAILAIIGVLYYFRDEVVQVWDAVTSYFKGNSDSIANLFASMRDGILDAFYALPQGVQRAMVAVVTVVRDAAMAVYEWFQYINPWARHSPSLVDNVTTGMLEVNRQFATLSNIKKHTSAAYAEIKRFGQLTAKLGISAAAAAQKEDKATLRKAGQGQALASYARLVDMLNKLTPILSGLETRMNAQERVVDSWAQKVEVANQKLEVQQDKLRALQSQLQKYQDKVSDAEASLSHYANSPLEGMRDMEKQIFRNKAAQTRLRHEMMKMEEVHGTFEEIEAKINALNGAQEILRGTQADLRAAGAGSEILGQYDSEIEKLEKQRGKYEKTHDALAAMQAQLDKLQQQAEKLNLVKAMKFDELEWKIQMAANQMEELSFDEIISGIQGAQSDIEKYGNKVDGATKKVEAQQAVVDKLTGVRDKLQKQLDKEQRVLDNIKTKYDEVKGAIEGINSAIGDVVASADKMNKKLEAKKEAAKKKKAGYVSPGLAGFRAAGDADFPDPGGAGLPPRKDWSSELKGLDKFTEELSKQTTSMFEDLNPFIPLKEKAIQFWNWLKGKVVEWGGQVGDFFGSAFGGAGTDKFDGIISGFKTIGSFVTEVIKDMAQWVKWLWDLLGPEFVKIGKGIWDGLVSIWDQIGPELVKFKDLFEPLVEALRGTWDEIKPILAVIIGFVLGSLKVVFSIIGEIIGPVLDAIGTILKGIIKVIRGAVEIILGVFNQDLGLILKGVKSIFGGLWDVIWGILKGTVRFIWNTIQGLVKGIFGFFVWLWDVLLGRSFVADFVAGLTAPFRLLGKLAGWVWDNFLSPLWGLFKKAFKLIKISLSLWWAAVRVAFKGLTKLGKWFWKNVLKPVWDWVSDLWKEYVRPSLKLWWAGVRVAFKGLLKLGKWFWKSILKPLWDWVSDLWKEYVRPSLKLWWAGVRVAFRGLLKLGRWFWDNVLSPIWSRVQYLWRDKVKPGLEDWWDGIKAAWRSLTRLGGWVWRNVMKPVWQSIKDGWTKVKEWLRDNKDMLTGPVKGIVNTVISGVNTMIKGLNKVADVLPGIKWDINLIPKLATGGDIPQRRVGGGFKTSGARAIVGEGKPNYPEYVIPTDPTYRKRARSLLEMADARVNAGARAAGTGVLNSQQRDPHGVPMFGIGGWLGDRWEDVKGAGKKFAALPRKAAGKIMDPILEAARDKIDDIGWKPIESPPKFAIDKLEGWVKGVDTAATKAKNKYGAPVGGNVAVADPISPDALTTWKGGVFTKRFVAHMQKAEELAGLGINVMQGGFRPTTSYSGTSHQGDAVDLQTGATIIRALRRVGIAAGDRTGLGNWAPHTHAVPGPSAGAAAGSAPAQWQDYMARGGMKQSIRSPWGLKGGGVALQRRGPTFAALGDGRYDEAVVPLPKGWRSGVGGDDGKTEKNYNFYGDLSFPNIKSGEDAEEFIENLKILARD